MAAPGVIGVRGAAVQMAGNPTTTGTVTIGATVLAGDDLYLVVTSRDSTGAGTLAVTDNDSGGNTWTKIGNSTDHKATVWHKRATSATASKTITVSNAVGSLSAVLKAFTGGLVSGTPYTNVTVETNASGDESVAGITPSQADSMVCFFLCNYTDDITPTTGSLITGANLGLFSRVSHASTGGLDCAATFAHLRQNGAAAATGAVTWSQTDAATYVIMWALKPEPVAGGAMSVREPNDTGSIDYAETSINEGTSTISVAPWLTFEGTTWVWYYFTITGANTRTPIIELPQAGYMNGAPAPGALHGTWSYDGLTWFNFDNVSFPTSPDRIRLSNNAAFNQNTVHVAHRAVFTWAQMEAKILAWMASPYTSPTLSGDVNGVLTTLPEVSNGFGRTCPAANLYAFKITDSAETGPKNSCVLNHTVHVGELPSTYALMAFIDLLLSGDPRGDVVRKHWIIYVYPDINPQGRYGGLFRTRPGDSQALGRAWSDAIADDWPVIEDDLQPAMILDTGGATNVFFDFHSYNHDYVEPTDGSTDHRTFFNGFAGYEHVAWMIEMETQDPGHYWWVAADQVNTPAGWATANLNTGASLKVVAALEFGNAVAYGVPEYQLDGERLLYALADGTEHGIFPVSAEPPPPLNDAMPNIRFLYDNRYDDAATTLTASSSASALPVGASKNPDRSYIWRSLTQTGVQTIDIDLGSSIAVNACVVANVKLVGTGVLQLLERGTGSSPGSATLVATMPTQDRDTRTSFAFISSLSKRHWQLKWTNPGAVSDYAQLGHCFLGTYLEPQRNIRVPARISRPDPSQASMSVDGQKTFRRRTKFFTGEWEFLEISEAQLTDLRTIFDTIGIGTPFYAVLDESLSWTSWFARFASDLRTDLGELVGRYTVGLSWEEVR